MPQYYTKPSDVAATYPSYNCYAILPPDFLWGSSVASSLGGGITRGTYELIGIAGFAGDGNFHIGAGSRGERGTTAIAGRRARWSKRRHGINVFKVANSHVNDQDAFSSWERRARTSLETATTAG